MTRKQRKIVYPTIFFIGLILIIWEIEIYRNTVINKYILLGIIFLVGFIAFILDFDNYAKTYPKYSRLSLIVYSLMHYIIGYGFIVCSIFMLVNYYFSDKTFELKKYEIIERSSMTGGKYRRYERQPLFRIKYEGKMKELVFPHQYYEKRNFYSEVEFKVKKGYFGFEIIEDKKLK